MATDSQEASVGTGSRAGGESLSRRSAPPCAKRRATARSEEIEDRDLYVKGEEDPDDQDAEQASENAEEAADDDREHDGEEIPAGNAA